MDCDPAAGAGLDSDVQPRTRTQPVRPPGPACGPVQARARAEGSAADGPAGASDISPRRAGPGGRGRERPCDLCGRARPGRRRKRAVPGPGDASESVAGSAPGALMLTARPEPNRARAPAAVRHFGPSEPALLGPRPGPGPGPGGSQSIVIQVMFTRAPRRLSQVRVHHAGESLSRSGYPGPAPARAPGRRARLGGRQGTRPPARDLTSPRPPRRCPGPCSDRGSQAESDRPRPL